jgi:energy-coupling factor transport system permease protein
MVSYKYSDKGTVVHRLNPWCKLAWIAGVCILALLFDSPVYLLLLSLSTLSVILAAKIWKEWLSVMKFVFFLCLLIIVINALVSNQGSHILYQFPIAIPIAGAPRITLEGILWGVGNSLRLLAIISAFTVLMFAIHPDDLMLAMVKAKLPYKSVVVTSLSTKFVPALIDDAQCIADGKRSRGLELDKGGRIQRVKSYASIAIPLLSNSLDRAVQVAEAMESRAFGSGQKRTFYKELKISKVDITILAFVFSSTAFAVFLRCLGQGGYQYYPVVEAVSLTASEWTMLFVLLLMVNTMPILALLKRKASLD